MLLALFTLAPDWKQPGSPLLQKGSNRVLCSHSGVRTAFRENKVYGRSSRAEGEGKARTQDESVSFMGAHVAERSCREEQGVRWFLCQARGGSSRGGGAWVRGAGDGLS